MGALGQSVRGAGWLGLGAGVVKLSQTVVLLILAAILAPSALGVLAIGALVLNVTSAVTDLGSSTALVYWRGNVERAARSALTLALGLGLGLTALAWVLAPWLSSALRSGDLGADVIRGLMLCLPFYSVAGVSQELLRRELAFKRRVVPDIIGALVGSVLAVLLALSGRGVYSLVIGQLAQAALIMVLCWAMRPPVRPGWRGSDVTGLVSYGGHLAGANILQLLMLNLDYLIVARVLGPEPLGIYSMAFRLAYMPYLLVSVVLCGAAFAHLCRLEGDAVGRALAQVVTVLVTLTLPLYLGMILLAPQLELLGHQWGPGVPALRVLAVYGLVLSLVHLAVVALNSVDRTRDGFLLNLLHLVLLAALLFWWSARGIEMVAMAQLVAGAAMLVAAVLVCRKQITGFGWRSIAVRLAPVGVGAVLMTVAALVAHHFFPGSVISVVGLLLVGALMVLVYLSPLVLLGRRSGLLAGELPGGRP
nr:oligosaccharide flippase family protein [Nocardioides daedukensis]